MMSNLYKYIALYFIFVISVFCLYYPIDVFSEKGIELQKEILIRQAQTHFNDQVNTRKWNAKYGGLYVKPQKGQLPNPYLKNNTLKVDENLTLIKINPAWMTRQLSEISDLKSFHFRITSLKPINPNNTVTPFEKKALEYFESTGAKEFYEFSDSNKFNYMGALETTKACLACHGHQGYKVGDIRGGISVTLDSSKYSAVAEAIKDNALTVKVFVFIFLLSITLLIHKQFRNKEKLELDVLDRTLEIESTKQLLQKILDAELSFLLLSDNSGIVFANKTMLDFFGFNSVEEFKKNYSDISDLFEDMDDEYFLNHYVDGEYWIHYLKKEQSAKELKVLFKKDGRNRYFKPHVKEMNLGDKTIHLIIFDEITNELIKMRKLEREASVDTLTKLFNRAKFNDVLPKEMTLSDDTNSELSLIFIDIDYFKKINDRYGHDEGDKVLLGMSEVLLSTVRQADFVARWGGEEFIVILQSTNVGQAVQIADKIRINFKNHAFDVVGNQTLSCGVTGYINGERKDELLKRVDEALYEAKESGRDRVVVK